VPSWSLAVPLGFGRRTRTLLIGLWLLTIAVALYVLVFRRDLMQGELESAASTSLIAAAGVYLFFGCIRGFTLMPSTVLIFVAIPFFSPGLLFGLTMLGILISAASIYWFSEALHIEELLARRHRRHVERLKAALERYELPVIVGWSFFPLVPTDIICYVCGLLRVNFAKYLAGIAIGEGVICALYIFLGHQAARLLELKF
jgi:uncharacterized membrane protein YdjX (TVP38/TMEM64 family)